MRSEYDTYTSFPNAAIATENTSSMSTSCNLVCDLANFQKQHVYFTEICKNNIVNGTFTKIQYSDSMISFHGIFLYFSLWTIAVPEPCRMEMGRPDDIRYGSCKNEKMIHLSQNRASLRMMAGSTIQSDRRIPDVVVGDRRSPDIVVGDRRSPEKFVKNSQHRHQICFSPTHPINYNTIKELNQIEYHLMEHYKQYVGRTQKQNVYSLRNQLRTGNLRIYVYASSDELYDESTECSFDQVRATTDQVRATTDQVPVESFYVLKISGIWETTTHVGITYKFMHIGRPIVMHK